MKPRISMFLLTLVLSFPAAAQQGSEQFREAMITLNKAYLSSFPCKSQIRYSYYSDYSKSAEFSYVCQMYASDQMQCMISEEIETYVFDTLQIFINHTEQVVSVNKGAPMTANFPQSFMLDSLWHLIEKVEVTEDQKLDIYTLHLPKALYSKIQFSVDKSTGLLSRIRLYANSTELPEYSKAMLEVNMLSTQKKFPFSSKKIIENKINIAPNGTVTLLGSLKTYKLLTPTLE